MTEGESGRTGRLVLVATPIGNLGDLSPRAREVLAAADLVCCEDTRRTRALLSAMGIAAGGAHGDRLLSLHGHNEGSRVERVLSCLAGGGTVAVVSDAGMPGISDPGALLVARAVEAGETVSVVPGPTSVVAALVVSGLPVDRFSMEGFLPRKGGDRRDRVAALMADEKTSVVLEAPGRVGATLAELAAVGRGAPGRGGARADQSARGGVAGHLGRGRRLLRRAPDPRRGGPGDRGRAARRARERRSDRRRRAAAIGLRVRITGPGRSPTQSPQNSVSPGARSTRRSSASEVGARVLRASEMRWSVPPVRYRGGALLPHDTDLLRQ